MFPSLPDRSRLREGSPVEKSGRRPGADRADGRQAYRLEG